MNIEVLAIIAKVNQALEIFEELKFLSRHYRVFLNDGECLSLNKDQKNKINKTLSNFLKKQAAAS